ncbi:MAG TPA: Abi-alpha family protein [Polyangiaceae bacterium]
MSEEIELAAETTGAVVEALVEKSGALEPARAYAEAITSGIHYRFYPRVVKQAMAAAKKIEQAALPRRAYSEIPDKLLKAILEGGSLEEDESMQARWANLLANALTSDSADVRIAFPKIMSELEPSEARLLDRLANNKGDPRIPHTWAITELGVSEADLENVERLELIRYELTTALTYGDITDLSGASREGFSLTSFGRAFVEACQAPQPPSSDTAET